MQSVQSKPNTRESGVVTPSKPPIKTGSSKTCFSDKFLIAFFWGVLLFFGIGTWVMPCEDISDAENRPLAPAPKLQRHLRWKNLIGVPQQFDAFYSDRILGRSLMVKAWNWMLYKGLSVSPTKSVAIGKKNWLFFLADGSEPVIRHEKPFTDAELKEWVNVLEYRTKLLADHGIKYMFVATPDKDSVYPEFVPPEWRPIRPKSRLNQLTDALKDNKNVEWLDVTDILIKHKGDGELFYKTDCHWNEFGGFIAYQEMMRKLMKWFPQLEPVSSSQVSWAHVPHIKGDCAKLMGLYGWIVDDAPVALLKGAENDHRKLLEPVDLSGKDRATGAEKPIPIFYSAPNKVNKLVFIHDSFGDGYKEYVAGHFNTIVEMRQDDISMDIENILAQKPDLVIQEVVERHIAQFTPCMQDWRVWAVQKIQAVEPKAGAPVYLNIVPNTPEICVNRFVRVPRHHGRMINPTSPRIYSERGDEVKFDPNQALWCQWYVLKTGDQGAPLKDAASEMNYKHLCDFVRNSGKFEKFDQMDLLDQTKLELWRQKN